MKIIQSWLREWIDLTLTSEHIASQLTMAGLEVEDIKSIAPAFNGVVVGEVIAVSQHPNADKLHVCSVNVASADIANAKQEPLSIICGASNVRAGLKVAVAMIGAVLPAGLVIKKAKLRGLESSGMLCSAKELGLENFAFTDVGIIELATDAPIGADLRKYLNLDDVVFNLALTPNRGDCASVLGIARELAAINNLPLRKTIEFSRDEENQFPVSAAPIKVEIAEAAQQDCPSYVSCIMENLNLHAPTPSWLRRRLEQSGLHSTNAIVDVTNYVMLELGQPLHAFDVAAINKGCIDVRHADDGERFLALNGQELTLSAKDLVIATANKKILALAGVIGASSSAVSATTTSVFLESAHFNPECIRQTVRRINLVTEASYRFERGVDATLPQAALAYARRLLIDICGGKASRLQAAAGAAKFLAPREAIALRAEACARLLGSKIAPVEMVAILQRLGMDVEQSGKEHNVLHVKPPAHRFDLTIEADLIEEIARLYGYDKIPAVAPSANLQAKTGFENNNAKVNDINIIKNFLSARGFREVITYSFCSPKMQETLGFIEAKSLELANPLSAELSRMRQSLLPGLLEVWQYNLRRQQSRLRIFESGLCFKRMEENNADNSTSSNIVQTDMVAALVAGDCFPLQWGEPRRAVDFYDLKSDVEALLALCGRCGAGEVEFRAHVDVGVGVGDSAWTTTALHPKQSANIYVNGEHVGVIGALHPRVQQELELSSLPIFVCELEWQKFSSKMRSAVAAVSKFPAIERDLAIVVDEKILWSDIAARIQRIGSECGGDILRAITLFDVYKDANSIGASNKSFALRLRLQHGERTLQDEEVDALMAKVVKVTAAEFGATIRK